MKRLLLGLVCLSGGATCAAMQACGGSDATLPPASDGGTDATGGDGAPNGDSAANDGGVTDTGSGDADAGPPCAPPTDPTKSALCVFVAPEAIQFLANDLNLDGKGLMVVDVHDAPNPDAPDGAPLPALQTVVLPSSDGGADAGELDLSAPVPVVRFDGLPASMVYPRVIFVDDRSPQKRVGAGWWLGGYDLSNGLVTPALLMPVSLTAGAGKSITVDLTALRRLHVTLTKSSTPVGNAQGPATVVAIPDQTPSASSKLYGVGQNPCAKLNLANAEVNGFVFGKGPYYAVAQLDDFGTGGNLAPGSLVSVALVDGGLVNPASTQLNYAASAYVVAHTVDLDLTIPKPDAGADTVVCP